jgi:hypothetical protein
MVERGGRWRDIGFSRFVQNSSEVPGIGRASIGEAGTIGDAVSTRPVAVASSLSVAVGSRSVPELPTKFVSGRGEGDSDVPSVVPR